MCFNFSFFLKCDACAVDCDVLYCIIAIRVAEVLCHGRQLGEVVPGQGVFVPDLLNQQVAVGLGENGKGEIKIFWGYMSSPSLVYNTNSKRTNS